MDELIRKFLTDIVQSANDIDIHLQGTRNFLLYQKNITMRRSVERELEIIGEAMKRLIEIEPNIEITDTRRIVNFRNRISHGYDSIEDSLVWGIVINHLPKLKSEVETLLKQE
jgi:uncharacterized protein with HEPN domain